MIISGAAYCNVPTKLEFMLFGLIASLANPKSISLYVFADCFPSWLFRALFNFDTTFSGVKSRWTICLWCRYSNPEETCIKMVRHSCSDIPQMFSVRFRMFLKLPLSQNSMHNIGRVSRNDSFGHCCCWPTKKALISGGSSKTRTTFSWHKEEKIFTSWHHCSSA